MWEPRRLTNLCASTACYRDSFISLTLQSRLINVCAIRFKINELYILPTQCIYVLRMVLTINSDYFPKQH
jgi:hypothetical protein